MDATIEREEWLILLTMIGDIRAELEGLRRLMRGDDGEETEDEP